MARPRKLTDAQILETARRVFLAGGPAVSTSAIAAELGVSGPALFKRFGSKRNLLIAAFAPPDSPRWMRLASRGPDDRPLPEQLMELAGAMDEFFAFVAPGFAVLRAAGIGPTDCFDESDGELPPPLRARRALADWFRRAREGDHLRDCDPELAATMLMSGIQSFHFVSHIMGAEFTSHAPTEERLRGIVDTLWNGIAPEEK